MGRAINHDRLAIVIDGDHDQADLAAALLEEADFRVVEIESAEQTLDYLSKHAAATALIFTDVRLSRSMDGVELARTVSRRWPWIGLLVTSSDLDERPEELPAGAKFMPKPWLALDVLVHADQMAQRAAAARTDRVKP
jgi:DNA-binding NtrC family response regulator